MEQRTGTARGRRPATGRFDSRAELCAWVWNQYQNSPANIADIARQCRVSAGVVSKILDTGEGRPLSAAQLEACAADVAALYRTYDRADWWTDRMFTMEFISDEHMGDNLHEKFARAGDRDLLHYGLEQVY